MTDANPQVEAQAGEAATEATEFDTLLKKEFKAKSDDRFDQVKHAAQTLAAQVLEQSGVVSISEDTVNTIESLIAEIDKKLSEQINKILHHEDFQKLEGAWRGLSYMVSNTETDEMLKIKVMNISKKDLGKTLKKFKGTNWDQSPIFKKMYEEEFGQFGALPTVDLTIHYRMDPADAGVGPDDFCLAIFRSRLAHAGYVEEDGEIWSPDGRLLAQSRQLAVILG